MKKSLLLIMISIISFLGINDVKADTNRIDFEIHNFNFSINENKQFFLENKDLFSNLYISAYEYYLSNYKDLYPYYHISVFTNNSCLSDCSFKFFFIMYLYDELPSLNYLSDSNIVYFSSDSDISITIIYDSSSDTFVISSDSNSFVLNLCDYEDYLYSNFDLFYNSSDNSSVTLHLNREIDFTLNNGDILPNLHDYFGFDFISDPNLNNSSYIEVDLNKYPYVALSLKDYNVDSFDSVMYVKGQLCPSGIYNYGMTSKEDYKNGYQVTDRCNIAYDNFTPTKFYVLDGDLKNHAIWYLKAFNTSIENKIKVDSKIFNIHYITEEEKDNPILNINGKNYTTIPYDELPSTATKNEEENYVPGAVEEFTFEGFFDKPLEALKSVWNAIISVFAIITEFIVLLPPTMQAFLYTSFGIAIVLGIIKILL